MNILTTASNRNKKKKKSKGKKSVKEINKFLILNSANDKEIFFINKYCSPLNEQYIRFFFYHQRQHHQGICR